MSFSNLNKEELLEVAEYFVVDVEAEDPEKGPTKKEIVAALGAGDDPVTWEDYKEAKDNGAFAKEDDEESVAEVEKPKAKPVEPVDTSNYLPIKFVGNNPTFEIVGYTFTKAHPYAVLPPEVAEYLITKVEGFRQALPSEIAEYYGTPR